MNSSFESESVMGSLLKKEQIDWGDFLGSIWEKKCHRFSFGDERLGKESNLPASDCNLWKKMVHDGWDILTHLLDNTHPMHPSKTTDETCTTSKNTNSNTTSGEVISAPLLFRDLQPMDDPDEIQQLFGTSLYAAYLAGTSIVWNHVENVSPNVAALCQDLQRPYLFPHAYANAYLTPPHSQTVPAHADDRDVLVFQLVGRKHWKVYETIPVPRPYTHEQVGKSGLPVPESVLNGPLAFDGYLAPGDVLYLPRGMVHEASTDSTSTSQPPELSFHITVALATHDWTLGGNLGRMIQSKLLETKSLRRSLLPTMTRNSKPNSDLVPCGGSLVDAEELERELNKIFERLRSQVTSHSLLKDMNQRIETHNDRASDKRKALAAQVSKGTRISCESDSTTSSTSSTAIMNRLVGPLAAQTIRLETTLRASTPTERDHAQQAVLASSSAKPGLTVRDGVGDDVGSVVGAIKAGTVCKVGEFRTKLCPSSGQSSLCDLTALSLAKRAVELGAFCIVVPAAKNNNNNKKKENDGGSAIPTPTRSPKRPRTEPL